MSYSVWCIRLLICGVFAVSAIGKLRGRGALVAFTGAVRELTGLGSRPARVAAVATVAAESLVAVAVLVPAVHRVALACAVLLLGAFVLVLARVLRAGRAVACRCFGRGAAPVAARHVVRNVVLAALAGLALAADLLAGPAAVEPAGLALCLLVAAVSVAFVALLDDIAVLLTPISK
ncbi:MauE/DoxX family redox-associated membrane protein [Dactylosporangium sp. NPDC000555]|uniref:MauE/DoxX family redox-associated membrane protein n=1 Tax=Dactylosporangium sp. NPDC000555 TaxID=3154260 RepID=UPI00331E12F0